MFSTSGIETQPTPITHRVRGFGRKGLTTRRFEKCQTFMEVGLEVVKMGNHFIALNPKKPTHRCGGV